MADDDAKRSTDEAEREKREAGGTPPAGPHADPRLTNPDATPGAGTLPEPGGGEADPAAG